MKKSALYIMTTAFALVVILALQGYTLMRIYSLEMDRIQNRYKDVIRNGLDIIEESQPDLGLKTAYFAIDYLAQDYLTDYQSGSFQDTTAFRKNVLEQVHTAFNTYQAIGTLVDEILTTSQIETPFKTYFVFQELQLETWEDTLKIYRRGDDVHWHYPDSIRVSEHALFMGNYRYLSTNLNCRYDFYIDFAEMERIVLSQIRGILVFMLISLLIVGFIFIATVRNMLEERRLSLLKTDFINNMTHELKTPLSTISIAASSLKSDQVLGDTETLRQTVRVIDRQNKYLSKQISHLLEVSMWERNQFELNKRWVKLNILIHDVVEGFIWECRDTPIQLINSCSLPDDFEIFLDEVQFTTALHNLLSNAFKYTKIEPCITVTCVAKEGVVDLRVSDNGIGMRKEHVKHVFDKFYRVPSGNIHQYKGLGLGLFYVRQIIEAHGGQIDVVSKINIGSEFIIKLPYHGRNKNPAGRG